MLPILPTIMSGGNKKKSTMVLQSKSVYDNSEADTSERQNHFTSNEKRINKYQQLMSQRKTGCQSVLNSDNPFHLLMNSRDQEGLGIQYRSNRESGGVGYGNLKHILEKKITHYE
jgi:hypothetical protein